MIGSRHLSKGAAARALVAGVVALGPAAGTLLAAPAAVRAEAPAGAGAWRADPRGLPDPVGAGPREVRRFWAGAGGGERRALTAAYPGVVGCLDGTPVRLRYAANARAMRAAGAPYRDAAGQYLLFDARGAGRVAEVFGDLAAADRIAVLVPGAGDHGTNFWRGVGGKRFRSPAVQARDLYAAGTADMGAARAERFAVVAWLGYAPPRALDQAAFREDRARDGARALVRFVRGLAVVRPRATVALLGHSYGSTVIGLAARRLPARVTDIAAFGSPGMGVPDARALGTRARVWAAESPRDVMRWVPGVRVLGLGHGTKPADPSFGARVFATGDVDHDHYLAPGTVSLRHLARIAAEGAA
ncbi:MAG TPA: alpha/beta hydrolase [Streptosporangiaceae bacterium]